MPSVGTSDGPGDHEPRRHEQSNDEPRNDEPRNDKPRKDKQRKDKPRNDEQHHPGPRRRQARGHERSASAPGAVRTAWYAVRQDLGLARAAAVRAVRRPGRERDLAAQSLKSALAALIAWVLAGWLFTDSLSLMGPWVAVVLVQSTVYQSLSQGLRQTVAIVIGTVLATGTALVLGSQVAALLLVLPAALLLGNLRQFGAQGITVATSTLFALVGSPVTLQISAERVGAAVIGALVGIAVNALVRPPRYLRDARAAVRDATDTVARTLDELADALVEGVDEELARSRRREADQLPARVEAVRAALAWDRESLRLNVRRRSTSSLLPSDYTTHDVVHTVDQLADTTRGLTRIVEASAERSGSEPAIPDWLAHDCARCLREAARAIEAYGHYVTGAESEVQHELSDGVYRARTGLDRLATRVDLTAVPDVGAMEILGPLLADTRRLVRALDTE
ncbi:hypothetical protein JGS22_001945 [Streptomyces sp. P38-E01]|uniref:FUSC family protein n=1 Tax=Streptomyces tardus TaxID=2780544 RepID=A0A949N334_9ACTN|nr:aromatic acid exporter family protein [Streptomyces tardus]MBU7596434.1 hypothetical protein [Streptomyces tardus]